MGKFSAGIWFLVGVAKEAQTESSLYIVGDALKNSVSSSKVIVRGLAEGVSCGTRRVLTAV